MGKMYMCPEGRWHKSGHYRPGAAARYLVCAEGEDPINLGYADAGELMRTTGLDSGDLPERAGQVAPTPWGFVVGLEE